MALVTGTGNTANNGPQFQPGQDMASPRFAFGRVLVLAAAIGLIYFYITLRGPDVEAKHKGAVVF